MDKMVRFSILICIICSMLMIGACRKELCYEPEHPHDAYIWVDVDWEKMTEEQYEMRLLFYPLTTTMPPQIRFVTRNTQRVKIPLGHYHVVAQNEETELVNFRGLEDYNTYEAYLPETNRSDFNTSSNFINRRATETGPVSTEKPNSIDTNISHLPSSEAMFIGQPDLLYSATVSDFEVTGQSATQQTLFISPVLLTPTLKIEIWVTGIKNAAMVRGHLAGVAHGVYLYTQLPNTTIAASALFNAQKTDLGLIALLNSFIILTPSNLANEAADMRNIITLEFLLNNAKVNTYNIDISDYLTLEHRTQGGHVIIDLREKIILPDIEDSGGFDVDIGDWEDEETIPLNSRK